MIPWPSLLLVGGAGRNSGKTRLCCSLIERFGRDRPLVGLKVTAVRDQSCSNPRNNETGGARAPLADDYEISEEVGQIEGKDTTLMLNSGAERVLWLRCTRENLKAGTAALIERVGPNAICICESNSLRKVVEPGLFLLVKDSGSNEYKPSSREVLHLADRVVLSDAHGFDLTPDEIELRNSTWTLLRSRMEK